MVEAEACQAANASQELKKRTEVPRRSCKEPWPVDADGMASADLAVRPRFAAERGSNLALGVGGAPTTENWSDYNFRPISADTSGILGPPFGLHQ